MKSVTQKMLSESTMRRYVIQKPNVNDIEEPMRKNIIIYNKKHERYLVRCVIKLLTTTNRVR